MSEQRTTPRTPEWTLGWRMKRSLAHAGISVQEISDHLEMSRGQVSRYLNDKGPVRRFIVREWALRCGVPYGWLLTGEEGSPEPTGPGAAVLYPPWDSNPEPADSSKVALTCDDVRHREAA